MSQSEPVILYGSASGTSFVHVKRVGNTAVLEWTVYQENTDYWETSIKIPEGMRPLYNVYAAGIVTNEKGYLVNQCGYAYASPSGACGFQSAVSSGSLNRGITSWPIAQ